MPRPQATELSALVPHDRAAASRIAGTRYRQANTLWLALQILKPPPEVRILESLADWAESLTSIVILRPAEGLLLEVRGSLKYFSGLTGIKQRLAEELERRGWSYRLAAAPTPLAAVWLARCKSIDISGEESLAGAIGSLPLAATAWPEKVQLMLGQMGLHSIADCLRLPRAGFARRIGRAWLDELDRALGKKPDLRTAYRAPQTLYRAVEFTFETSDRTLFARALSGLVTALEQELRRRQLQFREVELEFRHLRAAATRTRFRFVAPVHERARILEPLLARIERIALAEPAIALALQTGILLPLKADMPALLPASAAAADVGQPRSMSEYALVECLRGRFGERRVYGIGWVAEHRPEHAWQRCIADPASVPGMRDLPACLPSGRPLWLLPQPKKRTQQKKRGQSPFIQEKGSDPLYSGSDPFFSEPERIESGWWDGQNVRRDYHVVVGSAGEKLWFYRDCLTHEWYLHGIFG
jgi:protein ImuB